MTNVYYGKLSNLSDICFGLQASKLLILRHVCILNGQHSWYFSLSLTWGLESVALSWPWVFGIWFPISSIGKCQAEIKVSSGVGEQWHGGGRGSAPLPSPCPLVWPVFISAMVFKLPNSRRPTALG